jgi:hypothetical protein
MAEQYDDGDKYKKDDEMEDNDSTQDGNLQNSFNQNPEDNRGWGYERPYPGEYPGEQQISYDQPSRTPRTNRISRRDQENQPYNWSYTEYWMVPGPYEGVGPRDYHRTDERIYEDVCERLAQHGRIDASEIEVRVNHGEVTLTGTIPDRRQKRLAEDVIDTVWGVEDIHNQLYVRDQRGTQSTRSHTDETGEKNVPAEQAQGSQTPVQQVTTVTPTIPDLGQVTTITHTTRDAKADRLQGLRTQIREGMDVVGTDGQRVGKVKEIRDSDFLLDRPMSRDLYDPFDSAEIYGEHIRLMVPSTQINEQNWPSPDLFGSK